MFTSRNLTRSLQLKETKAETSAIRMEVGFQISTQDAILNICFLLKKVC